MLEAILAGIRDHKTVEQIAKDVDLSQYKPFGTDPRRTAGQVRSMYKGLTKTN